MCIKLIISVNLVNQVLLQMIKLNKLLSSRFLVRNLYFDFVGISKLIET